MKRSITTKTLTVVFSILLITTMFYPAAVFGGWFNQTPYTSEPRQSERTDSLRNEGEIQAFAQISTALIKSMKTQYDSLQVVFSEAVIIQSATTLVIFGHGHLNAETGEYRIGDLSSERIQRLADQKDAVALLACHSVTLNTLPVDRLLTFEGEVYSSFVLQHFSHFLNLPFDYAPLPDIKLIVNLCPGGGGGSGGGGGGGSAFLPLDIFTDDFYATTNHNGISYTWVFTSRIAATSFTNFLYANPNHDVTVIGSGPIIVHTVESYFFGLIRHETETVEHITLEYTVRTEYINGDCYVVAENFVLNDLEDGNDSTFKLNSDDDDLIDAMEDNNTTDQSVVAMILTAMAAVLGAMGIPLFIAGWKALAAGTLGATVLGISFSPMLLFIIGLILIVIAIVFIIWAFVALINYITS